MHIMLIVSHVQYVFLGVVHIRFCRSERRNSSNQRRVDISCMIKKGKKPTTIFFSRNGLNAKPKKINDEKNDSDGIEEYRRTYIERDKRERMNIKKKKKIPNRHRNTQWNRLLASMHNIIFSFKHDVFSPSSHSLSLYVHRHYCANMCIYPQSILCLSTLLLLLHAFFVVVVIVVVLFYRLLMCRSSLSCQSNLLWHRYIPKSVFKATFMYRNVF